MREKNWKFSQNGKQNFFSKNQIFQKYSIYSICTDFLRTFIFFSSHSFISIGYRVDTIDPFRPAGKVGNFPEQLQHYTPTLNFSDQDKVFSK